MSWIVAATKLKCEFIAKMNLEKQGYETYLPLSVAHDRPEAAPMFPSYIMVNTEPMGGLWRPINNTRGISPRGVLKTADAPSYLPHRVIETLLRREEAGVIRIKRQQAVDAMKPGQVVRIHEGVFSGFEGVFERKSGQERVMILLSYLGRAIPTELPAHAVA